MNKVQGDRSAGGFGVKNVPGSACACWGGCPGETPAWARWAWGPCPLGRSGRTAEPYGHVGGECPGHRSGAQERGDTRPRGQEAWSGVRVSARPAELLVAPVALGVSRLQCAPPSRGPSQSRWTRAHPAAPCNCFQVRLHSQGTRVRASTCVLGKTIPQGGHHITCHCHRGWKAGRLES